MVEEGGGSKGFVPVVCYNPTPWNASLTDGNHYFQCVHLSQILLYLLFRRTVPFKAEADATSSDAVPWPSPTTYENTSALAALSKLVNSTG